MKRCLITNRLWPVMMTKGDSDDMRISGFCSPFAPAQG